MFLSTVAHTIQSPAVGAPPLTALYIWSIYQSTSHCTVPVGLHSMSGDCPHHVIKCPQHYSWCQSHSKTVRCHHHLDDAHIVLSISWRFWTCSRCYFEDSPSFFPYPYCSHSIKSVTVFLVVASTGLHSYRESHLLGEENSIKTDSFHIFTLSLFFVWAIDQCPFSLSNNWPHRCFTNQKVLCTCMTLKTGW